MQKQSAVEITGRSEYYFFQVDECVTALKSTSTGEIMCWIHISDQSDEASAPKDIEAWKYYSYNPYWGRSHVSNIVLSVNGLSASRLMTTIPLDGPLQILNVPPAQRFNDLISQNYREESVLQVI